MVFLLLFVDVPGALSCVVPVDVDILICICIYIYIYIYQSFVFVATLGYAVAYVATIERYCN